MLQNYCSEPTARDTSQNWEAEMKKRTSKNRNHGKIVAVVLFLAAVSLAPQLMGGAAWGLVFPSPVPTAPLGRVPVPEPPNLAQFVKDKAAAIRLGKALFWDMQVGSDGFTACATCHFHAGADNRDKNSINPGHDGIFQVKGPNETYLAADFPFHQRQEPADIQASPVLRDTDDVVGSQGVKLAQFLDIVVSGADLGLPLADPVFNVSPVKPNTDPANNTRQVTGRNAPSVINAIFNYANFWDGRANNIFNGMNPFGPADPDAGVWFNENGTLVKRPVALRNASLASQATEPPLNSVEMSCLGRTFPEVGMKLLTLTPLGMQTVHPGDSVLGPRSMGVLQPDGRVAGDRGISGSYEQMIKDAFQDILWNSTDSVSMRFSQMEANFSLFFGLAIQLYEATLVSDQTPFDRFLAGDQGALTDQQKLGFDTFYGAGRCADCHVGAELTSASVSASRFLNNGLNELIQFMFGSNGLPLIYDEGYYNVAVRPTMEDLGRGGKAPFTNPLTGAAFPLSYSRLAVLQTGGKLPFATAALPPLVAPDVRAAVDGAFKTPGLRNVELTAPYFHNGGALTLDEVVQTFNRGGNFPMANIDNLHPAIKPSDLLQFTTDRDQALVAFLKALTDDRVRNESAPFDHPELFVPNGDPDVIWLPATDAGGNVAPTTVTLAPVATPTNRTSQTIGGSMVTGTTIRVKINDGPALPPDSTTATTWGTTVALAEGANNITVTAVYLGYLVTTVTTAITVDLTPPALTLHAVTTPTRDDTQTITGTVEAGLKPLVTVGSAAVTGPVTVTGGNWFCLVSGLLEGSNNITVTATDQAGNITTRTATITRKTVPFLSLDSIITWSKDDTQTISGTVEAGTIPVVTVNTGAAVGPVTIAGNTWSCRLSGLAKGDNAVTVSAVDPLGNLAAKTATVKIVIADGCFRGTGNPDISDALKALRMAVGIVTPTADDLSHGDVATDGRIDAGDALLILRKVVGLPSF
jgi:cytochrome c peroxidase